MPSKGASGGLLSIWDEDVFLPPRVLAIKFHSEVDNFWWAEANIYGPNEDSDGRDFWTLLSLIRHLLGVSWCFGGDFNMIPYAQEKIGGRVRA